jgi:hypothetical protein
MSKEQLMLLKSSISMNKKPSIFSSKSSSMRRDKRIKKKIRKNKRSKRIRKIRNNKKSRRIKKMFLNKFKAQLQEPSLKRNLKLLVRLLKPLVRVPVRTLFWVEGKVLPLLKITIRITIILTTLI